MPPKTTEALDLIEAPAALRALREVVAEVGPDFQYHARPGSDHDLPTDCRYVNRDKPDCIVAKALHKLGISVEELSQWEGTAVRAMCPSQFGGNSALGVKTYLRCGPRPLLTDTAAQILWAAQNMQDANHTYGVVLEAAEAKARELGVTA